MSSVVDLWDSSNWYIRLFLPQIFIIPQIFMSTLDIALGSCYYHLKIHCGGNYADKKEAASFWVSSQKIYQAAWHHAGATATRFAYRFRHFERAVSVYMRHDSLERAEVWKVFRACAGIADANAGWFSLRGTMQMLLKNNTPERTRTSDLRIHVCACFQTPWTIPLSYPKHRT